MSQHCQTGGTKQEWTLLVYTLLRPVINVFILKSTALMAQLCMRWNRRCRPGDASSTGTEQRAIAKATAHANTLKADGGLFMKNTQTHRLPPAPRASHTTWCELQLLCPRGVHRVSWTAYGCAERRRSLYREIRKYP